MPLYEFDCTTCGTFERRLGFADVTAAQLCESCAGPARRVFCAASIHGMPNADAVARENSRDRMKRARSGEPRLERRLKPAASESAPPAFAPLNNAHAGHRH